MHDIFLICKLQARNASLQNHLHNEKSGKSCYSYWVHPPTTWEVSVELPAFFLLIAHTSQVTNNIFYKVFLEQEKRIWGNMKGNIEKEIRLFHKRLQEMI